MKKKAIVQSVFDDLPKPAKFDDIMSLMRKQLDNQQAKQLTSYCGYVNGQASSIYGYLDNEIIGNRRTNRKLLHTFCESRNTMEPELRRTI